MKHTFLWFRLYTCLLKENRRQKMKTRGNKVYFSSSKNLPPTITIYICHWSVFEMVDSRLYLLSCSDDISRNSRCERCGTAPPRTQQTECGSQGPTAGANRTTETQRFIETVSLHLPHTSVCPEPTFNRYEVCCQPRLHQSEAVIGYYIFSFIMLL